MLLRHFWSVKLIWIVFDDAGSVSNVFSLLARREVAPQTKHSAKKLWGKASKSRSDSVGTRCEATRDARNVEEIILQEVKRGSKILSNIAVDNIVERLARQRYFTAYRSEE